MAKGNKKAGSDQGSESAAEEQKELVVPKDATIDEQVTVISLEGDIYHENDAEFEVGRKTAEKLVKLGRVKIKETPKAEKE